MDSHPDIEQILLNFSDYDENQLVALYLALKDKLTKNAEHRYSFGLTREGNRLFYFVLSRKSTIAGHNTLSEVIFSSHEGVMSPKLWNGFDDLERETFSQINLHVNEVNRQLDEFERRQTHPASSADVSYSAV